MEKVNKKISETLKFLRKESKWSLDIAAKKTGVSKAMLGQIERGESSPTIAILWKIASGFEVSFSEFIYEEREKRPKVLHPKDKKMKVVTLFPYDSSLKFETFIIDLLPGCEHISLPHNNGVVEHIVVKSGSMEVLINDEWKKLSENEGLRFLANIKHGYRNLSSKRATVYNIIHYSA